MIRMLDNEVIPYLNNKRLPVGSLSLFVVCTYNQTAPRLLQFTSFYHGDTTTLIGLIV